MIELSTELETTSEKLSTAQADMTSLEARLKQSEAERFKSEGREAELRAQLDRIHRCHPAADAA